VQRMLCNLRMYLTKIDIIRRRIIHKSRFTAHLLY
jgi:hypothetical protein